MQAPADMPNDGASTSQAYEPGAMRRRDFLAIGGAMSLFPGAAWSQRANCDQATDQMGPEAIPLGYDDRRFNGNAGSNALRLPSNGLLENTTITQTGAVASIVTQDGATIRNCRVKSRECLRIGGSGVFSIDNCYLEASGIESDHADVIQAYSPGNKGSLRVSNTAIVTHGVAANVGLFVADNWTGTIDLENVAFIGGGVNYGLRIHPDRGGDNVIRLKNVFFVPPFRYAPYLFGDVAGRKNIIGLWENVSMAVITDGRLVRGAALPRPF